LAQRRDAALRLRRQLRRPAAQDLGRSRVAPRVVEARLVRQGVARGPVGLGRARILGLRRGRGEARGSKHQDGGGSQSKDAPQRIRAYGQCHSAPNLVGYGWLYLATSPDSMDSSGWSDGATEPSWAMTWLPPEITW